MPKTYEQNTTNHLCPYVQTMPYQIKATFEEKFGKPCDPDGSFDQPGAPRARDWKDD